MALDRVFVTVGTCLGAWCLYWLASILSSPLRSIPGPLSARFTRLWYLVQVRTGKFQYSDLELHKKYGPVIRIAPNQYSIDDPSAMKTLYGHGTAFVKGPWYSGSDNTGPAAKSINKTNTFSERDPKNHAILRRKTASLYSMSSLVKMEPAVDECIQLLEKRFNELVLSEKTVNLQWWMQCYAFDVIGAITVSKRFGFLDAGEDPFGLVESLDDFFIHAATIGVYSEFNSTVSAFASKFAGSTGFGKAVAFTAEEVEKYDERLKLQSESIERETFLPKLLRLHHDKPDQITKTDVLATCSGNVIVGSDTTSISLTAVLWALIRNPRALKKLRAEIDEKYSSGDISNPISFSDAQSMPYLQAVFKESLRLHPPPGLPLSRVVPEGGHMIAGHFFPGGAIVGINAWVAHRNKDIFGDDPEEFRPERWLESKESAQRMENYWLPFGSGSRTCLGKHISMLEINKLIPQIIRKFDLELADPNMELETVNCWFVKQSNITVRIKPRVTQA